MRQKTVEDFLGNPETRGVPEDDKLVYRYYIQPIKKTKIAL